MNRLKYWLQIFRKNPNKIFLRELHWKTVQTFRLYAFLHEININPPRVSETCKGPAEFSPFFIDPSQKDFCHDYMDNNFTPGEKNLLIEEAEKICRGIFRILGEDVDYPDKIEWQRDFKSGYCWDKGAQYFEKKNMSLLEPGQGADVKVCWELSRLQFIVPLGQAYWLTNDEKYALCFRKIIEDWMEENPPFKGINWACPMDVAIRAANIIWGIYFFAKSPQFDEKLLNKLSSLLNYHGEFIWANPEKWYEHTGNHYLADLAGLIYLGIFLDNKKWLDFAVSELEEQIRAQVLPDGAHFEASIPYHRLSLECLLYQALLCRINNISLSDEFWAVLKKMFVYVKNYIKPDGGAPQIGDNDSGWFHVFGRADGNNHRYLLDIASVLFGGEISGSSAEVFWLFGNDLKKKTPHLTSPLGGEEFPKVNGGEEFGESGSFPDAGVYIMKSKNAYMLINCSRNGFFDKGPHAHNDKLSFELNFNGEDFIVDPGTYVYTSYPQERNLFRSTAYHNTVRVDGQEQNRIPGAEMFRLENDSVPSVLKWESNVNLDILEARHNGYARLNDPVLHNRKAAFDKKNNSFELTDILEGKEEHLLEWYFHLAPGICAQIRGSEIVLTGRNRIFLKAENEGFELMDGFYSPEYGRKIPAKILYLKISARLPFRMSFKFLLGS